MESRAKTPLSIHGNAARPELINATKDTLSTFNYITVFDIHEDKVKFTKQLKVQVIVSVFLLEGAIEMESV